MTPEVTWFPRRLRLLAGMGILALACGLMFRSHYRITIVSGNSMLPTLRPGDLLLVDRRAYDQREPNRGDIVVASYSAGLVVKRVVGLPGEEVGLQKGALYIDGAHLNESHPIQPGNLDIAAGKLLPGDFATLGDNRAIAPGLAVHPIVTKSDIMGKVVRALGRKIR